ncbi:hypothetical protein FOVG_01404 [Fusarium oxysporum f. sp. pisi HDV247]|uniref:Uncharacterized protein n=1 Tax=Fusarium oxysporum f. sp. pisi HDV247 TaxID=1080344 RepID=W9QRZ4_FUSOX|nr:hypothetical protein FOVG_01404 [Fusarium oxysporum f. sp. pisi HDV247]RKK77091.1 hypothetical protein BFJ71_g16819 [Fusarium oxysporum]
MSTDSEYESQPMASGRVQGGDNLAPGTEQQNLDENNDQACGSPSREKRFKECSEKILHSISEAKKASQELDKLQSMVNELLSFSGT